MIAILDISGRRYGRWIVVERSFDVVRPGNGPRWLCRCDCGTERAVYAHALHAGSKSCGCSKRDNAGNAARNNPAFQSWATMVQRCRNPRNTNFPNYGGRGITVCDRWRTFAGFIGDMGPRPDGTSLDRIDVNGNYEPGNCRWATAKEQTRNTRRNVFESHEPEQIRWLHGLGYGPTRIARVLGVSSKAVSYVCYEGGWR
jgi:hypothetical protein